MNWFCKTVAANTIHLVIIVRTARLSILKNPTLKFKKKEASQTTNKEEILGTHR